MGAKPSPVKQELSAKTGTFAHYRDGAGLEELVRAMPSLRWFLLLVLSVPTLFAGSGCLPGADQEVAFPSADQDGDGFPELLVLGQLPNAKYASSSEFKKVNRVAYDSTATAGAQINVWVSFQDYDDYTKITPDKTGSGAKLRTGAIIVRQVVQNGTVTKLTLMSKGPSGWNPDLGDYWFGVTAPDGTPEEQGGKEMIARLQQCYGCHIPRANDDFLFGVGIDVQALLSHP
jgi:hypothetical protein